MTLRTERTEKETRSLQATEKAIGRRLPCSIEAERAVLCSLLFYEGQYEIVSEILKSTDFYLPANRMVFDAIGYLVLANKRIDVLVLQDELQKRKHLQAVGGADYLISLQEDIPSISLIEEHARIIKEKSVLRELICSAAQIISSCYSDSDKEVEAVLDSAEKAIFDISNKRASSGFVQLNIWLRKTFGHLADIRGQSRGITGIATGYKKLDEMTSGLQNGDFIVLAARPSMGKTALALSIARQASGSDSCIGFFSLEMSAEQLTLRLLSADSGIAHHKIRNATVNSEEWHTLTDVAAKLSKAKIFIDDTAMQTVMDIRAKSRKLKAEHNLKFIVIDYLQLIGSHKKHENRHQEVSEISRSLKALAKELNIPILALSQLSRGVDSRVDKRPMLSDLRDSGAIEQDADVIMFLYRDVVYNAETENPNGAELILGKQRNGPTGVVNLYFHNNLTLFQDVD